MRNSITRTTRLRVMMRDQFPQMHEEKSRRPNHETIFSKVTWIAEKKMKDTGINYTETDIQKRNTLD